MPNVRYSEFVTAYGRNGRMNQLGMAVDMSYNKEFVTLFPINTRGIGNGWLQIPLQDIDKVIKALEDCKHD